jgi:SAM-dependent methyltransferase
MDELTHLTRFAMYDEISRAVESLEGSILGISGIDGMSRLIAPGAELTTVQYPEVDMRSMPFSDSTFDVVLSDQVVEHIPDPWRAVGEAHRVLKEGGLAVHTTCFLNPIHRSPEDYSRFTPEGLKALFPPDVEFLHWGSWGNRAALGLILLRDSTRFLKIPPDSRLRRRLATWNEAKYPITTWIVARKT